MPSLPLVPDLRLGTHVLPQLRCARIRSIPHSELRIESVPPGLLKLSRARLLEPDNRDPGRPVVWSQPALRIDLSLLGKITRLFVRSYRWNEGCRGRLNAPPRVSVLKASKLVGSIGIEYL